jgi:Tfp pilus assembly protein PilN
MKTAKEYINLLPPGARNEDGFGSIWWTGAAVFLVLWLVLFGVKAKELRDAHSRIAALRPQKQSLASELAAIRAELGLTPEQGAAGGKTELIRSLVRERVLWSEVFHQFARIIPRGVWFDSFEGSSADKAEIRIRGGAFNYRLISDFMLSMEQSGYFSKPELLFAQKAVVQGHDVVAFEIRAGVKRAQEER